MQFYSGHECTMGGRSGGIPFHITTGLPDWIFYVAFILVLFISALTVRAIRKDRRSGLAQAEREQAAIDFLLSSIDKSLPAYKRKNKSKK